MIIENVGKIISGIGLPFFIMMIFGITVFSIKNRDKKLFCGTAVLIFVFMFIWRSVMPGFYSSRYALSLAVFAIFFSAYLLDKLERSSWLLLFMAVLAFTGKNMMVDDGGKWIINVSHAIKNSVGANEDAVILVPGKDSKRIGFYSGYPFLRVRNFNGGDMDANTLETLLSNQYADNIFLCEKVKLKKKILTEKPNLPGSWELVYSELYDRKRKQECRLYRYRRNNAAENFVPVSGENLIANGDFELSGEPTLRQQKIFDENQLKYFSENKPALPKGWIVDTERPYNNCAAGIVEGSEVVSGRRSMMLQANNYACLLYNENGFTAKNPVKIQCRAKCSAGTEIFFTVCCKDPKGGTADQSFAMTSVKVVRDKETFTYSFVFDPQKYGVSDQSCFIRIYVWNGRMYLDDMSAVEIR